MIFRLNRISYITAISLQLISCSNQESQASLKLTKNDPRIKQYLQESKGPLWHNGLFIGINLDANATHLELVDQACINFKHTDHPEKPYYIFEIKDSHNENMLHIGIQAANGDWIISLIHHDDENYWWNRMTRLPDAQQDVQENRSR
jgi:hypothetical protein